MERQAVFVGGKTILLRWQSLSKFQLCIFLRTEPDESKIHLKNYEGAWIVNLEKEEQSWNSQTSQIYLLIYKFIFYIGA